VTRTLPRLAAFAALVLSFTAQTAFAAGNDLPPVLHSIAPTRLVVPTIGVDAPIVEIGLKEDGAMDSPVGPDPVGWYSFSPTPGNPGNSVFSGHRDWHTGVTGVFWRLGDLKPGDKMSIVLADGSQIGYEVLQSVLIGPDDMPIDQVVGQTVDELATFISCEGVFDAHSRDYDKRRVVWAKRIAF
jgi:LPXTG-site transpeptidase (sortase) family protein